MNDAYDNAHDDKAILEKINTVAREVRYFSHSIHHAENPKGVDFEIMHEYNSGGAHRLRSYLAVGDWSLYSEPAVLLVLGRQYMAYTEYVGEACHEVRVLNPVQR